MSWLFAAALVVLYQIAKLFALRWVKKYNFEYQGVIAWVRQNRRYEVLALAYFLAVAFAVFLFVGLADIVMFIGWLAAGIALFFLIILALSWILTWKELSETKANSVLRS